MSKKLMLTLSLAVVLSLFFSLNVFSAESDGWVTVDVTSEEVNYYGTGLTNWRRLNTDQAFNKVEISSDRDIHEVEFSFEGTGIRWLGSVGPMRGMANVYINDELVGENVDLYRENMEYQEVIFEKKLVPGVYTIKIIPTGQRSEKSSFDAIAVDAFQYLPSLYNKIAEAYSLVSEAPTDYEIEQKLVSFYYPKEAIKALTETIFDVLKTHNHVGAEEQELISSLVRLEKAMSYYADQKVVISRPSLYSFEGNLEDSLGGLTAIPNGNIGYADGLVGQGVNLDGSVYFQIPEDHPIATSEQMTIAAWVYWREGNQWQRILDFGNSTSQYFFLTPNSGSNTLRFAITAGSGEQFIETDPLPKKEWVHIAVTLKKGEAKLYVNGELAAVGEINILPRDFKPKRNYVGNSQWPDPLFNGMLDELYINNVVLSADEIQELM